MNTQRQGSRAAAIAIAARRAEKAASVGAAENEGTHVSHADDGNAPARTLSATQDAPSQAVKKGDVERRATWIPAFAGMTTC
jgi:hypothetical protein